MEWYRAWRHEERDREQRAAVDRGFRRREAAKRIMGGIAGRRDRGVRLGIHPALIRVSFVSRL